MACEYGPIAAGAFSVVTGLKEEWVVTAVDIVRVTCAAEETLSAIENLRLDDLGTILLRQRRVPDFDSCCNINGVGQNVHALHSEVGSKRPIQPILRSPQHI